MAASPNQPRHSLRCRLRENQKRIVVFSRKYQWNWPLSRHRHEITQLAPLNIMMDLIDNRIITDKITDQCCFTMYCITFHIINGQWIRWTKYRKITKTMNSESEKTWNGIIFVIRWFMNITVSGCKHSVCSQYKYFECSNWKHIIRKRSAMGVHSYPTEVVGATRISP